MPYNVGEYLVNVWMFWLRPFASLIITKLPNEQKHIKKNVTGLLLWATFVFIHFWSVAEDRAGSSKMSCVWISSSFIAEVFLNKSLPVLLFPETSARCFALLKVLVKCSWRLLCMCSCFTTWYSFEMLHWSSRSKHLPGGALGHPSCLQWTKKICCAVLARLYKSWGLDCVYKSWGFITFHWWLMLFPRLDVPLPPFRLRNLVA